MDTRTEFDTRLRELAEQFQDHADIINEARPTRELGRKITRQADADFEVALDSRALGLFGRLSATLAGGIAGAAEDPVQWVASLVGGGAGVGRTAVTRIASVVAREAAINAGVEAGVQSVAANTRRDAGLEYGFGDFARNVGLGAVFGGAFGGATEGIGELATVFKGRGHQQAAEAIERLEVGAPERGDVEAIADAAGVSLPDETIKKVNRAFDADDVDAALQADLRRDLEANSNLTPADVETVSHEVGIAAARHLEDPDRYPPPEEVEAYLLQQFEAGQEGRRFLTGEERFELAEREADGFSSTSTGRAIDPLEGETLGPTPLRDGETTTPDASIYSAVTSGAARRDAELRSGGFQDVNLDDDGNLTSVAPLLAVDEGDGVVRLVPAQEAIESADRPALYGDLLEACRL